MFSKYFSNMLEVKFNGETYKIKKSPMIEDIIMAMRKTIKKVCIIKNNFKLQNCYFTIYSNFTYLLF